MTNTAIHPSSELTGGLHRIKDIAVGGTTWRYRRSNPQEGDLTSREALARAKKAAARIHEQATARFAEIGYEPSVEDQMFLDALRRVRLFALGALHLRDELPAEEAEEMELSTLDDLIELVDSTYKRFDAGR